MHTQLGQENRWFVSQLAASAYAVDSCPGDAFVGYRFQPGAHCDSQALLQALRRKADPDTRDVFNIISEFAQIDARVECALKSLSRSADVAAAARDLGVCERTLERLVLNQTGRTPSYWKNLARVRRTARCLADSAAHDSTCAPSASVPCSRFLPPKSRETPLAEIAIDNLFTDQAHMCRVFRSWFGVTPTQFRANSDLQQIASASGYF